MTGASIAITRSAPRPASPAASAPDPAAPPEHDDSTISGTTRPASCSACTSAPSPTVTGFPSSSSSSTASADPCADRCST